MIVISSKNIADVDVRKLGCFKIDYKDIYLVKYLNLLLKDNVIISNFTMVFKNLCEINNSFNKEYKFSGDKEVAKFIFGKYGEIVFTEMDTEEGRLLTKNSIFRCISNDSIRIKQLKKLKVKV